jgi:hypothetical protein
MSDIVERLREGCGCNYPETTCMAEDECRDAFEAADTITRLTAEVEQNRTDLEEYRRDVERLRAALKQIAGIDPWGDGEQGYVDKARAALSGDKHE